MCVCVLIFSGNTVGIGGYMLLYMYADIPKGERICLKDILLNLKSKQVQPNFIPDVLSCILTQVSAFLFIIVIITKLFW